MTLSVAALIAAPSLEVGMPGALQTAAKALQVDRILILERSAGDASMPGIAMAYAWQAADVPLLDAAALSGFPEVPESWRRGSPHCWRARP